MTSKKKTSKIDIKKCEKVHQHLQKILNESKLNLEELTWIYGQLGYDIGASLEGTGLDIDTLTRKYYESPTIGVAFMLQGLTIQTWINGENENVKSNK